MTHSRRSFIAASVAGAGAITLVRSAAAQDLPVTPTQRIGPFYPAVSDGESQVDLTRDGGGEARGSVIEVSGRVLDRQGRPVGSALVLVWQADAAGRYDHPADAHHSQRDPSLTGHALFRTSRDGCFHLTTVRPGAYADDRSSSGLRTPHIHYEIIGEEARLITEMYFPDEPLNVSDANIAEMVAAGADPNLLTSRLEGKPRRAGAAALRWDVILAGR